ncbi:PIR protein [Plasmodium ovale]|uniref:PIR protein n=1 Tax=Plasmodium ovale TaxID=36330 RepID=A0A1C3KJW7_PLAOA|nr:PIR protein [Plasmodium ovale]
MSRKLVTGTYTFCINSNYYKELLQYVNGKSGEVEKVQNCENIILDKQSDLNESAKKICQEFKFLYKSFGEYQGKDISEEGTLTDYDCNFLNYWLNDKLRENVNDVSINAKEFYVRVKKKDSNFFSNPNDLEKHMHVIDPKILKNMKLLYKLYVNAVKIINIVGDKDYTPDEQKCEAQESDAQASDAHACDAQENQQQKKEEHKPCSYYGEQLDENYKEAMDRCLNSNIDYYNALKFFKNSYNFLAEMKPEELNTCGSNEFSFFPKYDPVPEKEKEKGIMKIKISSILSVLSLALPLIYKFTPFGPFLRAKINMVRNRWFNPDENGEELLPLSTDIEDNISDYGEYNIGYYSETN